MLTHRAKFLIQFNHKNVINIDNYSDTEEDKSNNLLDDNEAAGIEFSNKIVEGLKKAKSPFEKVLEREMNNVKYENYDNSV